MASAEKENQQIETPQPKPRYGVAQKVCTGDMCCGSNSKVKALALGPRKRGSALTDPLVHHGRHFGRTVYAFVNIYALIINGLVVEEDEDEAPDEPQARREIRVYQKLLKVTPSLHQRLMDASEEEVIAIAAMIQKGANSARSDDTKSLKSAVIDWIGPSDGTPLNPPIARNVKLDRGFSHPRTGFLLCPAELDWADVEVKRQLRDKELVVSGTNWPIFLYKDEVYDEEEPWLGLFRNKILVKVPQAYKHVFTSPSSVEREAKATRSGNARIHGMTAVTRASLAYISTQVRFSLTSTAIFSRSDVETDSETFYNSVLDLLEDPEEQEEVQELLAWWNK
ncbi:hypothetical protein BKA70DRAFT_1370095 [Coprinopsis sp. MPI-PUGE-AT-0042]|nr:hypothetical protein BKA70DRAFT_1378645 [Coprinopsis sp. MPI-PUGE-AT-0042]KAH6912513.1 hypothetical protein BKA70DRAFT_1370095 [Coprinopsis sp. MPI-PUGE-AT-0042]